jgi:hypothetical protein
MSRKNQILCPGSTPPKLRHEGDSKASLRTYKSEKHAPYDGGDRHLVGAIGNDN